MSRRTTISDNDLLYDTTLRTSRFSVLSTNKNLARSEIKLEDVEKVFSVTCGERASELNCVLPVLTNYDLGEDYCTENFNLNYLLFELMFGDRDVDALAINIIRICRTYKVQYATVTSAGEYIYHGDPTLFETTKEIEYTMGVFDVIARFLYYDDNITDEVIKNTHLRLIGLWNKKRYEKMTIHWNNSIVRDKSIAPIRIDLPVLIEYIRVKIPDLFNWLIDGHSSFGGQIGHVKTLICGYYACRFGTPIQSLNKTITGMMSYTLPNVKPKLVTVDYKTNTRGRCWAVAELILCLFRMYDPLNSISNLLMKDVILEDDQDLTITGSGMSKRDFPTLRRVKKGAKQVMVHETYQSDAENIYEEPIPNIFPDSLLRKSKKKSPHPTTSAALTDSASD